MNILVSGSSGLIGRAALERLTASGHVLARLVRRDAQARPTDVIWHPGHPLEPQALYSFDAVIHLAGRSVAGRWTPAVREEILKSRVAGTRTISEAVAQSFREMGKPHTLISASAIGYYGNRGEEVLTENSAPGSGFLAQVAEQWEAATWVAQQAEVRVVTPRIGIVLAREGGALAQMLPAFRLGLAGRIGDGRQYWSWITLEDVASAFEFMLKKQSLRGPVNLVANSATNAEFTRTLADVLHRPAILPLPAAVARVALGAAADELLLASQRVKPEALERSGFRFKNADLRTALTKLLS